MLNLTDDEHIKTLSEVSELAAFIRNRAIDKLCAKVADEDINEMIYAKDELLKILADRFGITEEEVWPKLRRKK